MILLKLLKQFMLTLLYYLPDYVHIYFILNKNNFQMNKKGIILLNFILINSNFGNFSLQGEKKKILQIRKLNLIKCFYPSDFSLQTGRISSGKIVHFNQNQQNIYVIFHQFYFSATFLFRFDT